MLEKISEDRTGIFLRKQEQAFQTDSPIYFQIFSYKILHAK